MSETRFASLDLRHVDYPQEIEQLVEDLQRVRGGNVRILTHEASPEVYNDPRVTVAFEGAKDDQGAKIHVITDSIVVVDETGNNGLIDLEGTGVLHLQHRLATGFAESFRVIDNPDGTYYFSSHFFYPTKEASPSGQTESIHTLNEESLRRLAVQHIGVFDSWAQHIAERPSSPVRLPLLITRQNLFALTDLVEAGNKSLMGLKPEELLAVPGARALFWQQPAA